MTETWSGFTMANCLIWGTPAQEMLRLGFYRHFKSPRTDGEYKITGTVEARVEELSPGVSSIWRMRGLASMYPASVRSVVLRATIISRASWPRRSGSTVGPFH
jgi:hypothetical protein